MPVGHPNQSESRNPPRAIIAPAKDIVAIRSTASAIHCAVPDVKNTDMETMKIPASKVVTSRIKASFTKIDKPITKDTQEIHLQPAFKRDAVTIFFMG